MTKYETSFEMNVVKNNKIQIYGVTKFKDGSRVKAFDLNFTTTPKKAFNAYSILIGTFPYAWDNTKDERINWTCERLNDAVTIEDVNKIIEDFEKSTLIEY